MSDSSSKFQLTLRTRPGLQTVAGSETVETAEYIVTLWFLESDGSVSQSSWSEYGFMGFTEAVDTVGWDTKTGAAIRGTVERVLESGGTSLVFSETGTAKVAPWDLNGCDTDTGAEVSRWN